MIRTTLSAAIVLLAGAALSSCSSDSPLSQSDVEAQVSTQLTEEVGQTPDDVSCPGDLAAKVGTKMTCVLTAGSSTIDVALVVTEVGDDGTKFSMTVADAPN